MDRSIMWNRLTAINNYLLLPGENRETLLVKQVWLALAMASFLYPVTEAVLLARVGVYENSGLRLMISGTVAVLMVIFLVSRRYTNTLGFLLSFFLILFCGIIQYRYGGLLHSAGVVFIGMAASILALLLTTRTMSHLLFVFFIVLMVGGTLLQPYMKVGDTSYPEYYKVIYITKFLTGMFALYLASLYFQNQFNRIKESEKDSLKELDESKNRFYTNMTHEFRTPLTMILSWAEHVRDDPKKNLDEGLTIITRNGNRLLDMVNQLMDIAKLEAGSIEMRPVFDDIISLVRNVVEVHRGLAGIRQIKLHFIPEISELYMDHDPEKIEAVISNILSNALKFTPAGGDIYIQIRKEGNLCILKIRDTGPGIPEEHLPFIFNRFYQVDDSATRSSGGSGIGLAVTKGLVELMGGTILASSLQGEGATFTVRLPARANSSSSTTEYFPSEHRPPAFEQTFITTQNGNLDKPLILVVEDHEEMLHFLETVLSAEYRVITAIQGKEGLELAIKEVPDLVISDIMMPEMDGYAMLDALKEDLRTSHIPVILLTAKADIDSRIHGLELGAEAYITKPFSKKELLVRVRKMFEIRKQLQEHYWALDTIDNVSTADKLGKVESAFLTRVRNAIEVNLDDPSLSVESLAKELLMSYSQLYRKLRSLTGLSPVQFIREIRLRKAKELLGSDDLAISEVAFQVGIEDPVYFTRIFKKTFGNTPSEYRSDPIEQ